MTDMMEVSDLGKMSDKQVVAALGKFLRYQLPHCAKGKAPSCNGIAHYIIYYCGRNSKLASLGEDRLAALGGELIGESHSFPYAYVGLFGAVVAFIAFYAGRSTRNDAYLSV